MTDTLLEQYIKAIVVEALKEESDFYNTMPKKGGAKHYRVVVPKSLQKPTKKLKQKFAPMTGDIEDSQREFLVNSLRKLPKNVTAQKILRGLPLTKKEVYVLAKLMIQSGMVPIRHFKELARILVGIAFEFQQNNT